MISLSTMWARQPSASAGLQIEAQDQCACSFDCPMSAKHSTKKMPFRVSVWATVLALSIAALALGACSEDADPKPATTADINTYLYDMNAILSRAYGRFEQLVRIFDDESYTQALSMNSRRFNDGAEALRGVNVPAAFKDEHVAYVGVVDAVAYQLTASLQRMEKGDDPSDVIASQIDGPLADAFARLDDACKQLVRQAEELGIYDAVPCGGDPYFIEAVEPPWSHRVFVNRCCGGSDPISDPLDIFYGSDEPWERTVEHYEREMKKRGFGLETRGQTLAFSKPDRPEECFSIREYREEDLRTVLKKSDVAGLHGYAYAYVTEYTLICLG